MEARSGLCYSRIRMRDNDFQGAPLRAAVSDAFPSAAPLRLLVFADMMGASQAIAFVHGLGGARSRGEAAIRIIEEDALGAAAAWDATPSLQASVEAQFEEVRPSVVVLSRFGLAGGLAAVEAAARARDVPMVFHIDDDLLDLPVTAGVERYRRARHPRRVHVQHQALQRSDLVLAATPSLADRLARSLDHPRIAWLENGTAGTAPPVRAARPAGAPVVVGYMGSASHGPDLELVSPALKAILADSADVRLELFGSIARQPAADQLPASVARRDVVAGDYAAFRRTLAGLGWDIGLAPLRDTPYNRCKTATKWAEYAEAGIAVAASEMGVYRPMIEQDAACGVRDGAWEPALRRLIADARLRRRLVGAADGLLRAGYGWERLETGLTALLGRVQRSGARAAA
jgi:hypothetical protein